MSAGSGDVAHYEQLTIVVGMYWLVGGVYNFRQNVLTKLIGRC